MASSSAAPALTDADLQAVQEQNIEIFGGARVDFHETVGGTPDNLLGTFMGVIVPSVQNIFGVIVFLRLTWIVSVAGIGNVIGMVVLCTSITFLTALSMSAISTNGRIQGGGAYAMISRCLGAPLGGTIGFLFWFGTTAGCVMYLLGAAEAFFATFPSVSFVKGFDNQLVAMFICTIFYGIVLMGIKRVSSIGGVFLLVVILGLVCIFIGLAVIGTSASNYSNKEVTGYNMDRIKANWSEEYGNWTFGSLLAILFPSFTGFEAGSNRSASLTDPAKSIPKGTMIAIAITSLTYMGVAVLSGCSIQRSLLRTDLFISAKIAWPATEVVQAAIIMASCGAGLQCLASAALILDAISADFKKSIHWLDRVCSKTAEPRPALLISYCLAMVLCLPGNLDFIAPIITVFLVAAYLFVNVACIVMTVLKRPSWRPTFQYYHWSTAGIAALLCLYVMFADKWYMAVLAIMICVGIYNYIVYKQVKTDWGDGVDGLKFSRVIDNLTELDEVSDVASNWRPKGLLLFEFDYKRLQAATTTTSIDVMAANYQTTYKKRKGDKPAGGLGAALKDMFYHPVNHKFLLLANDLCNGKRGVTQVVGIIAQNCVEDVRYVNPLAATPDAKPVDAQADPSTLSLNDNAANESDASTPLIQRTASFLNQTENSFAAPDKATMADIAARVTSATKLIKDTCKLYRLRALSRTVVWPDAADAAALAVQATGLGVASPNIVFLEYPHKWKCDAEEDKTTGRFFMSAINSCVVFEKAMLVYLNIENFPSSQERMSGSIDIWWNREDGGLMLLLASLLKKARRWHLCTLRLLTFAFPRENSLQIKRQCEKYLNNIRIQATVHVVEFKSPSADDTNLTLYAHRKTLEIEERHQLLKRLNVLKSGTKDKADALRKYNAGVANVAEEGEFASLCEIARVNQVQVTSSAPALQLSTASPTAKAKKEVRPSYIMGSTGIADTAVSTPTSSLVQKLHVNVEGLKPGQDLPPTPIPGTPSAHTLSGSKDFDKKWSEEVNGKHVEHAKEVRASAVLHNPPEKDKQPLKPATHHAGQKKEKSKVSFATEAEVIAIEEGEEKKNEGHAAKNDAEDEEAALLPVKMTKEAVQLDSPHKNNNNNKKKNKNKNKNSPPPPPPAPPANPKDVSLNDLFGPSPSTPVAAVNPKDVSLNDLFGGAADEAAAAAPVTPVNPKDVSLNDLFGAAATPAASPPAAVDNTVTPTVLFSPAAVANAAAEMGECIDPSSPERSNSLENKLSPDQVAINIAESMFAEAAQDPTIPIGAFTSDLAGTETGISTAEKLAQAATSVVGAVAEENAKPVQGLGEPPLNRDDAESKERHKEMEKKLIRMQVAMRYNELFREHSSKSSLIMMNLPNVKIYPSAQHFLSFVDVLTAGLDRVVLVRGTNKEVVTSFM